MQRKFTLWALMLLLTMGLSAIAADGKGEQRGPGERGGQGRPGMHGPGEFLREALAKLELSDDQRAAIRTLVEAHRAEVEAWREQHKDEIQPLIQKLREARKNRDQAAAKEAMEALRKLHEGGPDPKALLEQIKGQLTEQQQAKLQHLVEEARQRMGERGEGDRPGRRENRQKKKNN
jgi:Spy/CpxP family protein refolding chaperone